MTCLLLSLHRTLISIKAAHFAAFFISFCFILHCFSKPDGDINTFNSFFLYYAGLHINLFISRHKCSRFNSNMNPSKHGLKAYPVQVLELSI